MSLAALCTYPCVLPDVNTYETKMLHSSFPTLQDTQSAKIWEQLSNAHLEYLHHEDGMQKLSARSELESVITQYLGVTPHVRKFHFQTVLSIINEDCKNETFDPIKAANAWDTLAKYAANLLNQPWRTEFHTLHVS